MGDTYFISQFIKGLKPEIRDWVQGQVPHTMERAVMLAKMQQHIQDKGKSKFQKGSSGNRTFQSSSSKPDTKTSGFSSHLGRERNLRDYCRANNLCYYCKEPYDAAHAAKCSKRPQAQMNALVLNDLDVQLTDEVLNQLAIEDALAEEFCTLSLNAISGTENGDAMRLRGLVKNKVMLMLLDSGSSHTFVSSAFLAMVGLVAVPTTPRQVKLGNGDTLITDHYVPQMQWWIQGHSFTTDMLVIDMSSYDVILGYDWLVAHSPINHHWGNRTMEFMLHGKQITISGVPAPQLSLKELTAQQLLKWGAGNDIWAYAIVEQMSSTEPQELPPEITEVLKEFQDVFATPTTLPPSRVYDHAIPTLPNAIPVNVKPYRYSPLHKDEIERQVKELLAAGLITPSSSPFASPVLLIQKKMARGDSV